MVTIDLFSEYRDGEYDFEARRLAPDNLSFNRPDPKAADTPWLSPYLYCAANPIMYIDPTGEKIVIPDSAPQQFKDTYNEARAIMKEKGIDNIMAELDKLDEIITVSPYNGEPREQRLNTHFDPSDDTIYWDPTEALLYPKSILTPIQLLLHEGDHALQKHVNPEQQKKDANKDDINYGNIEEKRVITGSETEIARKLGSISEGEQSRYNHEGTLIRVARLWETLDYYLDNIDAACCK